MELDTLENKTTLSTTSLPSPSPDDAERSPTARKPDSAKPPRRKKAPSTQKPTNLACLSCRPRKIKCERVRGSCERCRTLKIQCRVPDRDERRMRYSKDYIADLENQISELKDALAASQAQRQSQGSEPATSPSLAADTETIDTQMSSLSRMTTAEPELSPSDTLITRLCGMRGRLNSNDVGQLRYFGPTSSLHLTESVSSSIFGFCNNIARNDKDVEKDVPFEMQQYLLNLYWTFQHTALPLIHKEAFLAGMRAGQSPYFSRCLLSCILACAARISEDPQVRALAIPSDDGDEEDRPVLMKQAEEALEKDLNNPSLTTVQSLMLLSLMDCCQSDDSRGWLRSGNACRLAFDLGLHQDWTQLSASSKFSPMDLEARQVVFWGCYAFDRLWALYLGRPPSIKLHDVSIRRPDRNAPQWDLRIFAAWVELLDLAGQISDKLNNCTCSQEQVDSFTNGLQNWFSGLEPSLCFDPHASPSVYSLHMQYSAIMILVHRHNAGFGDAIKRHTPPAIKSRRECVEHASRMARLLDDYKTNHGNAYTLIGSALYNITMAATTLVADISEKSNEDSSKESAYLATCLRTMKEMENNEIVARSVRKIVQTIMRVCNVGKRPGSLPQRSVSHVEEFRPVHWEMDQPQPQIVPMEQDGNPGSTMAALNFEAFDMDSFFPFPFEQALPNLQSAGDFSALDEFYQGSMT
ncbi:hypothetical protein LTR66_004440 [Elasticomyces elasticus]|nr:hypothetical protein LTR66_004440 [Elasticomyces elasticus]